MNLHVFSIFFCGNEAANKKQRFSGMLIQFIIEIVEGKDNRRNR